jgi:nitrogen fixation protein FixH
MSIHLAAREHGRQRSPLTGRRVFSYLLGFFGVVTLMNAVMIRFAVSTFGGVEVASSYKAGLEFSGEIRAAQAQATRQWQVIARIATENGERRIQVTAHDAAGRPLGGLRAEIMLAHPADRRTDRSVDAREIQPGLYVGRIGAPAGQWDLIVELVGDGERLYRSRSRVSLR